MQMISLRDESVARLLVGQDVEVSVGEPWDFEGPDGPNLVLGRVTRVGLGEGGERRQEIAVEVDRPFRSEAGTEVRRLLATARYEEDSRAMVRIVADGGSVSANLGYADQVPPSAMPEGVSPFLIGGLRLRDRPRG